MKTFERCLAQQLLLHPSMEPRDVVKLCYQAACGAEHLLADTEGARRYFQEEYDGVTAKDIPLYEPISREVCRVNLAAWKHKQLPKEWLFRIFAATVLSSDGKQRLTEYLAAAESVLRANCFDMDAWNRFMEQYKAEGMPAVRHSEGYRRAEQPAYRIVDASYLEKLNKITAVPD